MPQQIEPTVDPRLAGDDLPLDSPAKPERTSQRLELTPEQQELVNDLVETRVGRERRKLDGQKAVDAEAFQELETLRAEKKAAVAKRLLERENYDALIKSTNDEFGIKESKWTKERDTLLSEIRRDRVNGALVNVFIALKAINPEMVAKMVADRADLDDDRQVRVLKEDGQPWFKGGKAMGLKDLGEDFKARNPWAFEPQGDVGEPANLKGGNDTSDEASEGADPTLESLETDLLKKRELAKVSGDTRQLAEVMTAAKALHEAKLKKDKKLKPAVAH